MPPNSPLHYHEASGNDDVLVSFLEGWHARRNKDQARVLAEKISDAEAPWRNPRKTQITPVMKISIAVSILILLVAALFGVPGPPAAGDRAREPRETRRRRPRSSAFPSIPPTRTIPSASPSASGRTRRRTPGRRRGVHRLRQGNGSHARKKAAHPTKPSRSASWRSWTA